MIRNSWFVIGLLLFTGCSTVPSRERWLTPKSPPPPAESVLGQAPQTGNAVPGSPVGNAVPGSPVGNVVPGSPVGNVVPDSVMDDPWLVAAHQEPRQQQLPIAPTPWANGPPLQQPQTSPELWANGASPLPSPPPIDDPWGIDQHTKQREAVSIEEAAQKEEEMREQARLAEIATAKNTSGGPKYLEPLTHWAGPFADREQKKDVEQDIIRQAAYVEVSQQRYDNFPVYDWEKEEKKGFDWSVLDPVNFFTKVRDWIGMGPDERKANAAMKKGRDILEPYREPGDLKDKKIWAAAAKEFWNAARRWPDSVLEEDALHLAGECYYFAEDYPHALKCYEKLLVKYQHSKYLDADVRRVFSIARYWEQEARRGVSAVNMTEKSRPTFDTFGNGKKAYEAIFINDPNGPISDDAVMALASAYLARGRYQGDDNYDQAAYYFNYLRENFPLSKHMAKAHELELYARTNAYMGAEYNSKMLDEAGKLADVTLRQFGMKLGDDKEDIVALKEGVVVRQAEKEWVFGQHYDKKKYYGAARQYYEKLIDKYPQTEFAAKARQRLEEIEGLPPQPSQFELLEKIFLPRGG